MNFKLYKKPKLLEKNNEIKSIPVEGDYVYDIFNAKFRLVKQLGRVGGEGTVYLTDKYNYVCKIYKKDKNTNYREEKIKLLTANNTSIGNVFFPEIIVNNKNGYFVGYLMKKASERSIPIATSLFIPELLKLKFPDFDYLNSALIALKILATVRNIHNKNIIIGDINPGNILIDNKDVFFIDTDSYQINDYPCSVGMQQYTRRCHHKKKYSEYLRTKEDDIFAIMTLVFQIFLQGQLPYSFIGAGTDISKNMNPENFPYSCIGSYTHRKPPKGKWNDYWNLLPENIRSIFCLFFRENEKIDLNDTMKEVIYFIKKEMEIRKKIQLIAKQVELELTRI